MSWRQSALQAAVLKYQGSTHARRGCSAKHDQGRLECSASSSGFPAASTQTNRRLAGRLSPSEKPRASSSSSPLLSMPVPLQHLYLGSCNCAGTTNSAALAVRRCTGTCCGLCSCQTLPSLLDDRAVLRRAVVEQYRIVH
jgi:hypothetical protein